MEYTYEERHAILDKLEAYAMKQAGVTAGEYNLNKRIAALWWLVGYLGASITDEELARIQKSLTTELI